MNFCILPKNNLNNVNMLFKLTNQPVKPNISNSLFYYLNDMKKQLLKLESGGGGQEGGGEQGGQGGQEGGGGETIDIIKKAVNPLEFVNTPLDHLDHDSASVSKKTYNSNIFFELIEVFQLVHLSHLPKMVIMHLSPNHVSTKALVDRERGVTGLGVLGADESYCYDFDYEDLYKSFISPKNNPNPNNQNNRVDLLICEFKQSIYNDTTKYIQHMLLTLMLITKYQSNNGICIVKIDNLFYKPIIDILFLMSSFYSKIFLMKPFVSNIMTSERYVVCKAFNENLPKQKKIFSQIDQLLQTRLNNDNLVNVVSIASLINVEPSIFFLNKLEESNAIIGQQQLEAYDQIINLFNNKNRDEKIEHLRRENVQKCVQWCEKHHVFYNKIGVGGSVR
jgi:hypothetical protein